MTANFHINNTTKRQNKLCNSKNKMEQFARYLLPKTEHTWHSDTPDIPDTPDTLFEDCLLTRGLTQLIHLK